MVQEEVEWTDPDGEQVDQDFDDVDDRYGHDYRQGVQGLLQDVCSLVFHTNVSATDDLELFQLRCR